MTLRTRLFVTSGLVAVPLVLVAFLVDERLRTNAMADALQAAVEADLGAGLRERCESGAPLSPGPPPPPRPPFRPPGDRAGERPPRGAPGPRGYRLFTYAASGDAADPGAPLLPPAGTTTFWTGTGRGVQVRFDIGGSGTCAVGLARMLPRPGQLRDQLFSVAFVVLSVTAGAWIAAGPLIGRMRRLAREMKRSAASTYDSPVVVEGEDEVGMLAEAFNDAGATVRNHVERVQAREDALRQFVANTTHDVAIPMTVLQGHLSSLDRVLQQITPPSAAARVHIHDAIKETHYMTSLLRNLAVATKLGDTAAPLVIGRVDVSALVERVVGRHRPIARASQVEVNFAVPESAVTVSTDATLLEQVLSNLVDNAIRYNRPEGHVAVMLDDTCAGTFRLTVTDDGPGVADDDLANLTTRWFRSAEARTRRPDGKGLGLAIAAESCERLGFELAFRRPVEGGLQATLTGRASSTPPPAAHV